MSLYTETVRLQNAKTALANVIEDKGIAVPNSTKLDGYPDLVNLIANDFEKDVTFINVDGNVIKSYRFNELSDLEALPDAPQFTDLTFVGWSMTLEQVKALTYPAYIYPRYTVTDGKLHVIFDIPEDNTTINLYGICAKLSNGGESYPIFTTDWGDGTIENSAYLSGASSGSGDDIDIHFNDGAWCMHTYQRGLYDCVIDANTQMYIAQKTYINGHYLFGITNSPCLRWDTCYVKAIYVPSTIDFTWCGSNVSSRNETNGVSDMFDYDNANFNVNNRGYIVIDDNWTWPKQTSFDYRNWGITLLNCRIFGIRLNCDELVHQVGTWGFKDTTIKAFYSGPSDKFKANKRGMYAGTKIKSIPDIYVDTNNNIIADYAFCNCENLAHVSIPEGITSIGEYAFGLTGSKSYSSLSRIDLPSTITDISEKAFVGLQTKVYLRATTPPTLPSQPNNADVTWYVPRSAISNYENAVNWGALYNNGEVIAYDF